MTNITLAYSTDGKSEHGMVYRYRIVPIDYKVAGIIDAPMAPGQ